MKLQIYYNINSLIFQTSWNCKHLIWFYKQIINIEMMIKSSVLAVFSDSCEKCSAFNFGD